MVFIFAMCLTAFLTVVPLDVIAAPAVVPSQEQAAPVTSKESYSTSQPINSKEKYSASSELFKKQYILVSLGITHTEKDSADLNHDLANNGYVATSSIDRTNMGSKIVGGYKFTKYLGVEAGYTLFQKIGTKISASNKSDVIYDAVKYTPLRMQGAIVEGVATWDATPSISLIGKAGGFVWNGKVNLNSSHGDEVTRKDNGIDPILGVGADFHFLDQMFMRIEWERFFTPDKLDLFSAGVGMLF
ncbi:MAG: outer membrane beta-barrel protein [Magnetococcus sp. YQC-5]